MQQHSTTGTLGHTHWAVWVDDAAWQRRLLPFLCHGIEAEKLHSEMVQGKLWGEVECGKGDKAVPQISNDAAVRHLVSQRRVLHDVGPPLHCDRALE